MCQSKKLWLCLLDDHSNITVDDDIGTAIKEALADSN